MGDHDDQFILRNLPQDIHDLHAGLGIKCAGRFVGQQDIGVVDQCTRNRDTLHLTAGHLGGTFAELVAEADLLECFGRTAAAFRLADAGQRQCQLDVGEHRLMRNQVIALEDETDAMVAVTVPVAVTELFGRTAIDNQVAAGILIQTADDIQQSCFAGTGGTEYRNKLCFPKGEADAVERLDLQISRNIVFTDLIELEHPFHPFTSKYQNILHRVHPKCNELDVKPDWELHFFPAGCIIKPKSHTILWIILERRI